MLEGILEFIQLMIPVLLLWQSIEIIRLNYRLNSQRELNRQAIDTISILEKKLKKEE